MDQRFNGSIDVTTLVNTLNLQGGHSAFSIGKNGKMYANVTIWLRDEPDQFGNVIGIQLNSSQKGQAEDLKKTGGKAVYVGNAKPPKNTGGTPATGANLQMNTAQYGAPPQQNNQPWQQGQQGGFGSQGHGQGVNQDLPF